MSNKVYEISHNQQMHRRVWEPSRDRNGDIIFPLRWSSRAVTTEDFVRRSHGDVQVWQDDVREIREMMKSMA